MQTRQGYSFQSLRAVQDFLTAHADKLGTIPNSGTRKKLDIQIAALDEHATRQCASNLLSQGATQRLYALRQALLYEHMRPIACIAAAELDQAPGLQVFRMPRGTPNAEVLHAAAIGMADAAEPHAAIFIDAALPQDFLARLRAAADVMLASIDARTEQRGSRQGATKGLKETIRSARRIVDVLDALVSIALKDNVALLASWNSVKRPAVKPGKATASDSVESSLPRAPVLALVYRDVGADMEVDGLSQVRPPGLVRRVA